MRIAVIHLLTSHFCILLIMYNSSPQMNYMEMMLLLILQHSHVRAGNAAQDTVPT